MLINARVINHDMPQMMGLSLTSTSYYFRMLPPSYCYDMDMLAYHWPFVGEPNDKFSSQGPVMRNFIFVNPNKLLTIQLSCRFEAWWRLCGVAVMINAVISQYLSAPMPTGIAIQKNDYFTKVLLTVSDILPNIQKRVWRNFPSFFSLLAVYEYYSH